MAKLNRVNSLPTTGLVRGDQYMLNVGGGKYQNYVVSDSLQLVKESGYEFIEKDTIDELRSLSAREIWALQNGYYKGVTLNGYHEDEPKFDKPINYYLSETSATDDGGSVIAVGGVKLEHKFDVLQPEYFGAKGDGIADDTTPLENCFNKLSAVKKINITKRYLKKKLINLGSLSSVNIYGEGEIISDNCDGIRGFFSDSNVTLKARLINSTIVQWFGIYVSGNRSKYYLESNQDGTSQYDRGIVVNDIVGNDFTIKANGNRMGLTDETPISTIQSTLKGTGIYVGYGINNTFNDCYSIYWDKAHAQPFVTHPNIGHANEGSMYINSRFLWSNNCMKFDVGLGCEMTNCMLDIAKKEALIINNVDRFTISNVWLGTSPGYSPWNNVIDNSKGILITNLMLGAGNANALQVKNSTRVLMNNIISKSDGVATSYIQLESTLTASYLGVYQGVNIINNTTDLRRYTGSRKLFNFNYTDLELGGETNPLKVIQNSMGNRVAPIDSETTNLIEVYSDSSNSNANNFQIGKTTKGMVVRHSGVGGWKTNKLFEVGVDTVVSSTGLATTTGKGLVNQASASEDTATQASGATPTKAEFDALLAELRDLKTKFRTAGTLA